jgi:hypothetical protein
MVPNNSHPQMIFHLYEHLAYEEKRGDLCYGFNLPGLSYLINYFLCHLRTPKLNRNDKNEPEIAVRTPIFPNLIKLFEQVTVLPGHQP